MIEERLVLAELLEKAGDGDFLRDLAEAVVKLLIGRDVEGLVCAGPCERSGSAPPDQRPSRPHSRHSPRALQLRIPKLRQRLPSRKRGQLPAVSRAGKSSEKALIAARQKAWIGG